MRILQKFHQSLNSETGPKKFLPNPFEAHLCRECSRRCFIPNSRWMMVHHLH